MSFIAIISSFEDYEFIKNEILKNNINKNIKLINVNQDNITNMKNIKFETVIICKDLNKMKNHQAQIYNIIKKSKYLIINTDINTDNLNIEDSTIQTITYGMNQKATVTASSIKEDEILICLQRNIENIYGKKIEIQESKKMSKIITQNIIYNLLIEFIIEQLYNRKLLQN